jgi:hypothetical protein
LVNLKSFTPQALANTAWAYVYATANELRSDLFETISIAIAGEADFIISFNEQNFANVAWAYAVANADAPMIFNDNFTCALLERQNRFS